MTVNMFSSLLLSMKVLGLYPEPLGASSVTSVTFFSPQRSCSSRVQNICQTLGIVYATALVILAWFNASRYFTLFFGLNTYHLTDVSYYGLVCLYFVMGATLRTVCYVGCLSGKWQLVVRAVTLCHRQHALTAASCRKLKFAINVITAISWFFLLCSASALVFVVYFQRQMFGMFATPLHLPSANLLDDDNKWLLATFFAFVLNFISDAGGTFGNVFICCLTLCHSSNFRNFVKYLKTRSSTSPSADLEQMLAQAEINNDDDGNPNSVTRPSLVLLDEQDDERDSETKFTSGGNDDRLSPSDDSSNNNSRVTSPGTRPLTASSPTSTSSSSNGIPVVAHNPVSRTSSGTKKCHQLGGGFFDIENCRDSHLRLLTVAREIDKTARLGIFASMCSGFCGSLILLYQLAWGSSDTMTKANWLIWLVFCYFLLFAHLLTSADLANSSESLISDIYSLIPKRVTCLKPSATQLTVLLSQLATERVSLTLLGLINLRKESIIALFAAMLTYFLILVDYAAGEKERALASGRSS